MNGAGSFNSSSSNSSGSRIIRNRSKHLTGMDQKKTSRSGVVTYHSDRSSSTSSRSSTGMYNRSRSCSPDHHHNNNSNMTRQAVNKDSTDRDSQMLPLLIEQEDGAMGANLSGNSGSIGNNSNSSSTSNSAGGSGVGGLVKPISSSSAWDRFFLQNCASNPDFFKQAAKFMFCFLGLQVSYLTWGYMQELIMTTTFNKTEQVPDGRFPSAAFCVFSNRFLAVLVALVAVRIKHGAFFANNKAPLLAFTPCALSNTMSSWSQYASLKYVSFPVQTVFKSSKIIPVMMMGKFLKGTKYQWDEYIEAILITAGVAIFSLLSKQSNSTTSTELLGLIYLIMYISFDSFTSQWQDKVYQQYGRTHVDPYQMMLGVNMSAICITTAGLILSGDLPIVIDFLIQNPVAFHYNVITAVTSASGQLFIFYTIKEFGPIVFTIIMTTRQMFSICLSAIIFGHHIKITAALGAALVFGVLFYQIYKKYTSRSKKTPTSASSGGGGSGG